MPTPVCFLLCLALAQDTPRTDASDRPDPLANAYEQFRRSPAETQATIVAEIARRIEQSEDQELRAVLALRDRARRELKIVPKAPPSFHDAATYAPGQQRRRWVEAVDSAQELADRFYRVGAAPLYVGRVAYDFGNNVGVDSGADPTPEDALWNYLYGYPPAADVLVAWLEHELDHDDSLDALACHFAHAYCDLNGNCFANITLFDAFASEQSLDMPDVDCIAYARNLLHDDSFVSPIPPDERQQALYRKLTEGHLRYFRHRTFVEYVANLFINPEIPISWAHEQLRDRILYGFHVDGRSVTRIRNRMILTKDRLGWVDALDRLTQSDPAWLAHAQEQAALANTPRWAIAHIAYDVLRQNGLLTN
ncbi:MAG: hypothetical protein U1E76_23385 [Planctomycetota bacterium]